MYKLVTRFQAIILLVLIGFATACAGQPAAPPTSPTTAPATAPSAAPVAFDEQALIEAAKKEGKINWYTLLQRDQSEEMARRFTEKYGIPVEVFRETSAKVLQKFDLEAQSGQMNADVLLASDLDAILDFKSKGYLAPSPNPNGMLQREGQFRDSEGYWYTFYNLVYLMAYNSKLISDADAPKSWQDLADPKYKDKLAVVGLFPSGAPFIVIVQWYKMFGDEWIKGLAANTPMQVEGHAQMNTAVAAGERPVMAENALHLIMQVEEAGIKPVWPTEGPMLFPVVAAKANNAPHPAAADLFLNWMLSPEVQDWFNQSYPSVSALDTVPVRFGIPPKESWIVPDLTYVRENRDKIWELWRTENKLQ